jgi:SNF2 family DNA or RNA helicase
MEFITAQERTAIKGSIVALACGLGKTATTLGAIDISASKKEKWNAENPTQKKQYRATLIVVPGAAVPVWQADVDKFFGKDHFAVHQYYGTRAQAQLVQSADNILPKSKAELNDFLHGLDPEDPKVCICLPINCVY